MTFCPSATKRFSVASLECRPGTVLAPRMDGISRSLSKPRGSADIARDNGFSTWLDAKLNYYVDAELGYTRSIHYDLNSISFSLGFNVGRLVRRSQ